MSLRVLVAVTHLLGVGHLTRAAALARAFAAAGHDAVLASGGMPAPLVRTEGIRLVQLPPVRTTGTDFTTLLDESGQPVTPARLEVRRDMLIELIDDIRPDVVATELFPFGRRALAGEFMTLVEHAAAQRPDALIMASVRDILVAPAKPDRVAAAHSTLKRSYDAVLVHGDPGLVPLEASWPFDEETRSLLRYTGYVDHGSLPEAPPAGAGEIVVSGGSSAASLPLYRAALATAALVPDRRWHILVGGGVAEREVASLREAAPANALLERARADFRGLLAGAAVSVSQAGYNTAVDVLRAGCRAVFVPFEQGNETEQRLRAERLAARGFGEVLREAELSPAALAAAVQRTLRRRRPDPASIALDGAERSVAIVEGLARNRSKQTQPVRTRQPSGLWSRLDDALSQAMDRRTPLLFWWRDDDAVAQTPALDRLIALARAFDAPVALAVVPSRAEASLAARLADEPLAGVLVHGLAHANHAGAGRKKAELGADRPLAQLAGDAAEGLHLAKARFSAALPVLVPPWNRIAPELVPDLPKLGFRGLSTFGRRPAREPARGLVQVNTHFDPIDWHNGRSLRAPDELIAQLAAAIAGSSDDPGREPIGLLTHHLVQDEATWSFCEALLARLAQHAMVQLQDPCALFAGAQTAPDINR